jgi:hypothetical protein
MYFMGKLKPDRSITGLIPALVSLMAFGVTAVFLDLKAALYVLAVLIFLYALFSFAAFTRTRNTGYLAASLFQLSLALGCATLPRSIGSGGHKLHYFFFLCEIFFGMWLAYLFFNKKIKWRGREILELAAAPVEEIGNGYTGRPLPAGKIEYSKRDVMAFAEFAARHLIAWPYVDGHRVIFVPVMMGKEFGYVLGLHPDYAQGTWISFDFDGNVSVNISKDDYLTYKEDLSFDRLCESLGNVFAEFLDLFKKGESIRIIDRMDALGLSIFS